MSKMVRALLSGFFLAIPAMLYLGFHLRTSAGEYYYTTYLIQSVVFLTASFSLGGLIAAVLPRKTPRLVGFLFLFLASLLAWTASSVFLLLLNMTPLCVGQDNGDGNNNLGQCVLQSVLVSGFYGIPVLFGGGVTSLAATWLRRIQSE